MSTVPEKENGVTGLIKKPEYLVFFLIFIVGISFAFLTNHAWEDFWITFRVSKNLAAGLGPVYTAGERVHAFTSPLNMLIPALIVYLTGNISDALVLWVYRVLCCILLGVSAVFFYRISKKNAFGPVPTFLLIGLLTTDAKIIDFSINGQEVAFMVFFIAATLYILTAVRNRVPLKLGLAWAGLMYTRPDGFIYAGGIALGFLVFNRGIWFTNLRPEILKTYLKAAGIAAALYAPWFLWAWYYYGSPIPHTIIAKGLRFEQLPPWAYLTGLAWFPAHSPLVTFLPAYGFAGWPRAIYFYSFILSFLCLIYWMLPSRNHAARAASFGFFLCHYYLSFIIRFPATWYIPSTTILGIFILGHAAKDLLELSGSVRNSPIRGFLTSLTRGLVTLVLIANFVILACVAVQFRIVQRVDEEGIRRSVGLWLKYNALKTDTVFLEPLGYIGYYSNLKMYDFPGLASKEVVAVRKKFRTNSWKVLIPELKPDWVVRRPWEHWDQGPDDYLKTNYTKIGTFSAYKTIASYDFLPGIKNAYLDSVFCIYKRNKG